MRIETTIEFPHGIPCKKEILGLEYPIEIASFQGTISFPNLPIDWEERMKPNAISDYNLTMPTNADMQLSYDQNVDWGYFSSSDGDSCIKKCRIWFLCDSDKARDIGNILSDSTAKYFDRLVLFLECLTNNTFDENTCHGITFDERIHFLFLNENGNVQKADQNCFRLFLKTTPKETYISKELMIEAITYTNKGFELNLCYKLLRDAIFHKNKNDYRRSILDASTATELALTKIIESTLKSTYLDKKNFTESLLKKYHSLSGRIELSIALNIKLPHHKNDYSTSLSTIRNRAIHAGYMPTLSETNTVIEIARHTVNEFCNIHEQ